MNLIWKYIILFLIVSVGCGRADENDIGRDLLDSAERDYLVGEYIESLKSIHEYIRAVEEGDIKTSPELDTKAYKFLGNIHYIFEDSPGAIKSYTRALESSLKTENSEEQLKLLFNLSIVSSMMSHREESKKYIDRIAEIKDTDPWLRSYFRTLASAYYVRAFGDSVGFIKMMRQSLRIVEEHNLETYLKFNPYEEIAAWLEQDGQYAEALSVLRQYEKELIESGESPERMISCIRGFMNVYMKTGDRQNALDCQNRYMELSDSLKNRQRFFKANNLFKQYSLDDKQDIPTYGRQSEEWAPTVYALIFAVMLMISAFVAWKIRQKKQAVMTREMQKERPERMNVGNTPAVPGNGDTLHPELFDRAVKIVENPECFSDPDFSVETLANMLGSNVKYVSQSVKSNTGGNFRAFLNSRRIREARAILDSDEDIAIHDVALRVGFLSQSSFIAAFRKETGNTPSQYHKNKSTN